MEQAAEQVLEYRSIGREQTADLAGIALEPGSTLAGEGKHQPGMLLFARRHLKDPAKSRDFVAGDDPVGSRPPCAQAAPPGWKAHMARPGVVRAFGDSA